MPIKPENAARYPKDWKQVRARILARSGHRCEACGVWNGDIGYRDDQGRFVVIVSAHEAEGSAEDYAGHATGYRVFKIVLTIAHLDHTPENCADSNLKAWCQKCHLAYDHDHHQLNAAATRRKRKGTAELFA